MNEANKCNPVFRSGSVGSHRMKHREREHWFILLKTKRPLWKTSWTHDDHDAAVMQMSVWWNGSLQSLSWRDGQKRHLEDNIIQYNLLCKSTWRVAFSELMAIYHVVFVSNWHWIKGSHLVHISHISITLKANTQSHDCKWPDACWWGEECYQWLHLHILPC